MTLYWRAARWVRKLMPDDWCRAWGRAEFARRSPIGAHCTVVCHEGPLMLRFMLGGKESHLILRRGDDAQVVLELPGANIEVRRVE